MRLLICLLAMIIIGPCRVIGQELSPMQQTIPLLVKKCPDFNLTGRGDNNEWNRTAWNYLTKLDTGGKPDASKFKILYSSKGIYVLLYADDDKISTGFDKDFEDLFKGDVFEVFFHTDPKTPLYLEYEINQLNKELVLLVPNKKGKFYGWLPWHYEKDRSIIKMVDVNGGKKSANATITSWSAELFFPFELFNTLGNVPPTSGTLWNANFYRLDYDSGKKIRWAWAPVDKTFHQYDKFRPVIFE